MRDQTKQIQTKSYQFQKRELGENYQKQLKRPSKIKQQTNPRKQKKKFNQQKNRKQEKKAIETSSQNASTSRGSRRIFRNINLKIQVKRMPKLE